MTRLESRFGNAVRVDLVYFYDILKDEFQVVVERRSHTLGHARVYLYDEVDLLYSGLHPQRTHVVVRLLQN